MPILFNETYSVDPVIHKEWRKWVSIQYVPKCVHLGKFLNYRISRMLNTEETNGMTYSIQFLVPDQTTLEKYYKNGLPQMQQSMQDEFGEKALVFRTIMELEEEGPGRMN